MATLDGKVNVLDVNDGGKLLWSKVLGKGPLLHSTLADINFKHNQVDFRLIPSLGETYQYYSNFRVLTRSFHHLS